MQTKASSLGLAIQNDRTYENSYGAEPMRGAAKPAGNDRIPYPFSSAKQMLEMSRRPGLTIAQMDRANELTRMDALELDAGIDRIWDA